MRPYVDEDIPRFNVLNNEQYDMDIVGFIEKKGMNYGWVKNVRVFVLDDENKYKPGDSVGVTINKRFEKSLVGEVVEEHGCFLDDYIKSTNDRKKSKDSEEIYISNRGIKDVRNCLSENKIGYGFKGMFTILRRTKPDIGKYKKFYISDYGTGNDRKYYVIADPVMHEDGVDTGNTIYVYDWYSNKFPRMDDVRNIKGVYKGINEVIFFAGDGRSFIINEDGRNKIGRHETDSSAIFKYRNRVHRESFKLILDGDRDPGNSRTRYAIEKANIVYRDKLSKKLEGELLHDSLFL